MTVEITNLKQYKDERGNVINYTGRELQNIKIIFTGRNNTLNVADGAGIRNITFSFDCDNGVCNVGANRVMGMIRIGQDCTVTLGKSITCTGGVLISAAEGVSVTIGDDCMIATGVEIRADDAHPFFDVATGKRVNKSRNITIGNHVWLAAKATILTGGGIGDGSVLGYGSILKKKIPNNCVSVGIPAKVVKKNIAWERPHLNLNSPFYKPDSSTITKSDYWNPTMEDETIIIPERLKFLERVRLAFSVLSTGRCKIRL